MVNQVESFHAEGNAEDQTVRFVARLDIPSVKGRARIHVEVKRENREADLRMVVPADPGASAVEIDETVELPNAEPWSAEKPVLYGATLRCIAEDKTVAEAETSFGFRQLNVSQGRFCAGKKWFAVRVAALGPRSDPLQPELAAVKELGFNTVAVEGQRAEEVLSLADGIGLAVLVTADVGALSEDVVRADPVDLIRHPSFLGSVGEGGSVFINTSPEQLAALGSKTPDEVLAAHSVPRPDGRPALVRVIIPHQEDFQAGDMRAPAEAVAMLRMATGIAGYCLSIRGARHWETFRAGGSREEASLATYLPVCHGLTVLLLRAKGKQSAPGESAAIAIFLLNAGGYTGDATLVITDTSPDKTRRTHRQPVHITLSSRSFSPVTLTAPSSVGEWQIDATLIGDDGSVIGQAIPWCVDVSAVEA